MYSLAAPAVLVTDVACRPAGGHLLRLLDEVLLLDRVALGALCDALLRCDLDALVAARRAARAATEQAPTHDDVVRGLQAGLAPAGPGAEGTAARLARAPTGGGLPALLDLVAEQALPPGDPDLPTLDEQAALSAVGDALTEAWHADVLDPSCRAVLRGPWLSARCSAPRWLRDRAGVLGPHGDGVRAACARVRRHGPEVLGGLAAAHGRSDGWHAQMHEAAWAAYLSDRLRAVAHAQVEAAGALLAAAGPAPDPVLVRCALPAVLGAVTASALQDVLPDGLVRQLTEAWTAVDGT